MKPAAGLLAGAAVLVASCAGPRNVLNTQAGSCFPGVPRAVATVGHKGRLVGVRQVAATRLARRLPEAAALGRRELCLVAFRDDYRPGDIPDARPSSAGKFAIVALDGEGSQVLATFVVGSLPLPFRDRL
jgi:hypothetical protein